MNTRLSTSAETYYIHVESQTDFCEKKGTTDNIFALHGLINHFLNKNNHFYCAFIGYSKAFDYLVHDNIWYKLYKIGLRGNLHKVIKSLYNHIFSRVKLSGQVGESFESHLGVRKGECLSPFLFTMYLNDLEDELYLKGVKGISINHTKMFFNDVCRWYCYPPKVMNVYKPAAFSLEQGTVEWDVCFFDNFCDSVQMQMLTTHQL